MMLVRKPFPLKTLPGGKSNGPKLPNLPGFFGVLFPVLVAALVAGTAVPVAAQAPTGDKPAAQSPAPTPEAAKPSPDAATPSPTQAVPVTSEAGAKAPSDEAAADKSPPGKGSSLIPHDLSPYGMFKSADIIVQVVMVGLAFASVVTWTILLAKGLELAAARSRAGKSLATIAQSPTLRDAATNLGDRKAPVARLVDAALSEAEQSQGLPAEGVKERAAALLSRLEARAGRSMGRGTGLLATIGSTAPFVGLFGTVWGIMNSFIGISKTNTTNLAVVAPGIAEALLATAFGLVAAIPAVVIYNFFARGITGYRSILGDASTEVLRLLSRDLDRDGTPDGARVMPIGRAAE